MEIFEKLLQENGDGLLLETGGSILLDTFETLVVFEDTSTIDEFIQLEIFYPIDTNDIVTTSELITIENPSLGDININEILSISDNFDKNTQSFINVSDDITLSEDHTETTELSDLDYLGEYVIVEENTTLNNPQLGDINVFDEQVVEDIFGNNVTIRNIVTISESVTLSIPIPGISIIENVTLSENFGKNISSLSINVYELAVMLENYTLAQVPHSINKNETITISEEITKNTLLKGINLAETITISESRTSQIPFLVKSITDSISIIENINPKMPTWGQTCVDSITISEIVRIDLLSSINTSSNLGITDNFDKGMIYHAYAFDTLNTSESTSFTFFRQTTGNKKVGKLGNSM